MKLYATTGELAAWLDPNPAPADPAGLLRSASGLIRSETKTAIYATDTDGYPTVPDIRDAFRDATCAQAKFWADHKVTPNLGPAGVAPAASSKSIGGASITYVTDADTTAARAQLPAVMAPDAWYILNDAGLLGGQVILL